MANESELKIKITSVADTTGTEAQTAALEKLDLTASKTANSIAVAQAKQELAERSVTQESREAQREAAQSALRDIARSEAAAKNARAAANSAKELSAGLQQVSRAGKGASDVINGLAQGGLPGLIRSGKGAVDIFRTLTTGALGPALLGVIAGAGAAMYALKVIVGEAQAEIVREQKKGIESAKRYKEQLEANQAASEKSLKAQLKDVEQLTTAWTGLDDATDHAQKRFAAVDAAKRDKEDAGLALQEQQALATAKTPEERDSVSRRFDGVRNDRKNQRAGQALDQQEAFANDRTRNADQVIVDSNAKFRDAESQLADKQSTFDRAKDNLSNFPIGSDGHIAAQQAAKIAQDALEKEKENFAKVIGEMTVAVKKAEADISEAAAAKEVVAQGRQTLELQTGADATQRATEAAQRLKDAQQPIQEITNRRQAEQEKLTGLEDSKSRSLDLGGNKETLAAIEATKAQIAKDDAELAEAQTALALAQKEAAAAQLKQTTAQKAAAADAARQQLEAQEGYHTKVVDNMRGLQEQLDRQAKQIAQLNRARKATADSAQ